jgi:hypothetical protein
MRASIVSLSGRAWQRISQFLFTEHRKVLAFFVFVVFCSLTFPHIASAQLLTGLGNELIGGFTAILLGIAKFFLSLTLYALDFFLNLAAYNAFIDAPPVVVGWFMVRDLANMFFIVALLIIAFSTMLGLENYAWKKSLVKLIAAAILINFSRLILGVLIDASQIITLTFLNAVEGAAGGDLINMLKLDQILSISTGTQNFGNDGLQIELLGGAVAAVIFSVMSLFTIGAYAALMLVRVLILWMLIILSPLAFVLSALPQTKSYASEFWGELTKYLIVGPMMAFFLWLAFATLGNGQISSTLGLSAVTPGDQQQAITDSFASPNGVALNESGASVSVNAISRWENLSSFFIAVGFLLLGIERVQKIGVRGTDIANSIISTGKKVTKGALKVGAAAGVFGTPASFGVALGAGAVGAPLALGAYKGYKLGKHGVQIGAEKMKQQYYQTLGKGDLIREGSLGEYKATTDAVKGFYKAKGSEVSGAGDALAQAIVSQTAAKKTADEAQKKQESEVKKKRFAEEQEALREAIEKEKARRKTKGLPAMDKREEAEFKNDFINNNGDSMILHRGMSLGLQAEASKRGVGEDAALEDLKASATEARGGVATNKQLFNDELNRKKMAEFARLDTTELEAAMKEAFENAQKAIKSNDVAAQDVAAQDLLALQTAALERKEGKTLVKVMRELAKEKKVDESFLKIDDAAEDIPQLLLGLQGKLETYTSKPSELSDTELKAYEAKIESAQKQLENNIIGSSALAINPDERGKAISAFRNLKVAMDTNAEGNQAYQWKGQLVQQNPGSSGALRLTHGTRLGYEVQKGVEEQARRDQTLSIIKKVGSIFKTEVVDPDTGETKTVGFVSDSAKELVDDIVSASLHKIESYAKPVMAELGKATDGPIYEEVAKALKNKQAVVNTTKDQKEQKLRKQELNQLVRALKERPQMPDAEIESILKSQYLKP